MRLCSSTPSWNRSSGSAPVERTQSTTGVLLDTHVHADHVTAAGTLRTRTGCKTGVCAVAGVACADIALSDGQTIDVGRHTIEVRATPGHTSGCMTFWWLMTVRCGHSPGIQYLYAVADVRIFRAEMRPRCIVLCTNKSTTSRQHHHLPRHDYPDTTTARWQKKPTIRA